MFGTAIKRTDVSSNFIYNDGTAFVSMPWHGSGRYSVEESSQADAISLVGDREKILLYLSRQVYHFWIDSVGPFLSFLKTNAIDNPLILLDTEILNEKDEPYLSLFKHMLSNLNLEYLEIKTYPGSVYEVNNFYYLDKDINLSDNWASRVYEMFLPYLEKPAKYRKAYISRSSIQDRKLENLPAGLDVYDDNRIYDEDLIEDFFRKRGYDIVNPEAFDKYIDQANFFHSCKVIAGVTGSGLFNVTFMQPGSTVLEIQTPLVINSENQNMAVQELQYDYTLTSYQKGHRHISIPNPTRMSKDIIEMMSDIVV